MLQEEDDRSDPGPAPPAAVEEDDDGEFDDDDLLASTVGVERAADGANPTEPGVSSRQAFPMHAACYSVRPNEWNRRCSLDLAMRICRPQPWPERRLLMVYSMQKPTMAASKQLLKCHPTCVFLLRLWLFLSPIVAVCAP